MLFVFFRALGGIVKRSRNKLKETIARGEVALGTCIYSFSPAIVEVAGYAGLVWCRIDNEHAWRQDESAENMVRAGWLSGVVPILRVDEGNPAMIRKGLEAGAGGVIIPHVRTASEAARIVEAAKFPPAGHRGFSSFCSSGHWGVGGVEDGLEWLDWSNQETLVILMIEDPEGVSNINEIMAVEGVDAAFFGPGDFSVSAGIPLQTGHPRVKGALAKTVEAARSHGKFVICGAKHAPSDDVQRLIGVGVQAVEIGHDVSILGAMWKRAVEEVSPERTSAREMRWKSE